MKKTMLSSVIALMSITALADNLPNSFTLYLKDNTTLECQFDKNPKITYTETEMVLTAEDMNVSYPLSDLLEMHFGVAGEEDAIKALEKQAGKILFTTQGIQLSGMEKNCPVQLYTIDGKLLKKAKIDAKGEANINLPGKSGKTYILKVGKRTMKIQN